MKALDVRHATALHANPRPAGQFSRRRLVGLLAASAGALVSLAGCGGDEARTPGGYTFPGAEKDASGNFKMRGFG